MGMKSVVECILSTKKQNKKLNSSALLTPAPFFTKHKSVKSAKGSSTNGDLHCDESDFIFDVLLLMALKLHPIPLVSFCSLWAS